MNKLLLALMISSAFISNAQACTTFDCASEAVVDTQKDFRQPNAIEIKESMTAHAAYVISLRDYMKDDSQLDQLWEAGLKIRSINSEMIKHKVKTLKSYDSMAQASDEIQQFIQKRMNEKHIAIITKENLGDMRNEIFNIFMNRI